MTRKIIYQFDSMDSTGFDKIPLNSLIQIHPPSNDLQKSVDLLFTLVEDITDPTKKFSEIVTDKEAVVLGNSNILEYDYPTNTLSIYF